MKVHRKIIEIDDELCDGCGQCIIGCAEGALEIVDGKAKVVAEKFCDGLGACIGECPTDALRIVEREVDEFDEIAVEKHLAAQKDPKEKVPSAACGCPSTQLQSFTPTPCQQANQPAVHSNVKSALSHWPIQIHLVPPHAPFLNQADLLVVADCTPLAFPNFHEQFLPGRVVLVGCPKLDDQQAYIDKFSAIFNQADIASITTIIMEVPCCGGLPYILEQGMQKAGITVPTETVVISTRGKILDKRVA